MTGSRQCFPSAAALPTVTTDQMIEVDRRMIEDVGITLFQMMENAGLQLANVARDLFLNGDVAGKRIAVLAGTGGNGGGAIVAARRLVSWGATCDIGLSRTQSDLCEVPLAQFEILKKISSLSLIEPQAVTSNYDLIIDGLIGYSLRGAPRGRVAEFILAANAADAPILSLDVPSGFDGTIGEARTQCMRADATMTLALPKFGMLGEDRSRYVGRLLCADISCPKLVFAGFGLEPAYEAPFSKGPVIELT